MWLQHLWCSILTSKVQSSKTIAICSGIYQMLGYMRKIQLLATPLDFRKLSSFPPVHDMHYGILIPKLKQKTLYRPRSSEPKASTLLTWLEEQNEQVCEPVFSNFATYSQTPPDPKQGCAIPYSTLPGTQWSDGFYLNYSILGNNCMINKWLQKCGRM